MISSFTPLGMLLAGFEPITFWLVARRSNFVMPDWVMVFLKYAPKLVKESLGAYFAI